VKDSQAARVPEPNRFAYLTSSSSLGRHCFVKNGQLAIVLEVDDAPA